MWEFIRDQWQTWKLRGRCERKLQEQVLEFLESSGPRAVSSDDCSWTLLGGEKLPLAESQRTDLRSQARRLVVENPHARNLLRLLEVYVVGPELRLDAMSRDASAPDRELEQQAGQLWRDFLDRNHRHFSYREYARRAWRDGECFLRLYPRASREMESQASGQRELPEATVRFIDPERIGPTPAFPDSQGILTQPEDVETPESYLHIDPRTGELREAIPAGELLHCRLNVDSNQKRGLTIFSPLVELLAAFEQWRETELTARKLQASIVLWRKIHGSPAAVGAFADAARTGSSASTSDLTGTRRERYQPGTILTTSQGTDLQFLQPHTNFADAVPLGRVLLLSIAAGAGLPEFMLTADAANANFASTMVAEGPAVKLFEAEQQFFAREFTQLWRWVMSEAIRFGSLPADLFTRLEPKWTFPQLVSRDRNQERLTYARLAEARILSRAEVARREGANPETMRQEIREEGE